MKIVSLKCPNCGANLKLEDNKEIFYCSYCRAQLIKEEEKSINYNEKINIVDHKFETALAEANNYAQLFFSNKKSTLYDFNNVLSLFSKAELLGAHESRVYFNALDFIIKASLNSELITYNNFEEFEEVYERLLKLGFQNEKDEIIIKEMQEEYENKKDEYFDEFKVKLKNVSWYKRVMNSPNKKLAFWLIGVPTVIGILINIVLILVTKK